MKLTMQRPNGQLIQLLVVINSSDLFAACKVSVAPPVEHKEETKRRQTPDTLPAGYREHTQHVSAGFSACFCAPV